MDYQDLEKTSMCYRCKNKELCCIVYQADDCSIQLANWNCSHFSEHKPQGEWTLVNERLPNLDDYTGSEVWQRKVLITGYFSFDDTKNLFVSEVFAKDIICNRVPNTIVIAWQPLPEPYKGDKEE